MCEDEMIRVCKAIRSYVKKERKHVIHTNAALGSMMIGFWLFTAIGWIYETFVVNKFDTKMAVIILIYVLLFGVNNAFMIRAHKNTALMYKDYEKLLENRKNYKVADEFKNGTKEIRAGERCFHVDPDNKVYDLY